VIFLALLGLALPFGALVALSLLDKYDEHQKRLSIRSAKAEAGIKACTPRIALLRRVLPELVAARHVLHSDMVELVGAKAEFEHTLATARAYKEGIAKGAGDQQSFDRAQYKHAIDLKRMQNQLAGEIDRAAMRPLRAEAQRTRLRVEANERVVENILTQQAIEEARGHKRGTRKPDKVAVLRAELGELIEQYKADAEETAGLEQALEALTDSSREGES
jgi:hypothetical protein